MAEEDGRRLTPFCLPALGQPRGPRLRGRAEKSLIQELTKALTREDGMIQHSLDTSPFMGNHLYWKSHSNEVLNLVRRSFKEDERISSSLSARLFDFAWTESLNTRPVYVTGESMRSSVLSVFNVGLPHREQERTDSGLHMSVMCLPPLGRGTSPARP